MFQQNKFDDLNNRHDNNVRFGYVVEREIGPQGVFVRVSYPDRGVTSGKLPVEQGTSAGARRVFLPRINDFVKVTYPASGMEDGIVTGAFYTPNNPPPEVNPDWDYAIYDDGSYFYFDPDAKKWVINTQGEVDLTTVGPVKVVSTGDVDVTTQANLNATVTGNLSANVTGSAQLTSPAITLNGPVTITGLLTVQDGMNISGTGATGGKTISMTGDLQQTGNVNITGNGTISTHMTNGDGEGGGS